MREDISIDGNPNALRDITNSSINITKDARTERRLKLLQKRNKTNLGITEVSQSEIVNVQSVGATQPVSARQIEGENTISQGTYCDSQVTFQPTVKENNCHPKSSRATNLINSVVTSTAITVDSDSSDSCDDLWDCSSNEGGEILSDSDTSDDITSEVTKRDAQKKYELVSKAEKAFAEMLSRLNKKIPPKTLTPPIVCSKNTKKKGMLGPAKEKISANSLNSRPIVSSNGLRETAYKDDGDLTFKCPKCQALFWYNERVSKSRHASIPVFTMCCMRGKIKLPLLQEPPEFLQDLLTKDDAIINMGKGPKVFKLHGENFHLIGSMKPKPTESAKFSQLYIHDTENEVQNRIAALSGNSQKSKIREDLVEELMNMLRDSNVHVKTFRSAMDRFNDEGEREELSLENMDKRDIILEKNSGKLKRISELHPCYLPLQYPLIFPYGEDGFRLGSSTFTPFTPTVSGGCLYYDRKPSS
ncbi:unnamed protein product [Brassica napus]|uniref:(rape) hypothetical protein n=1 Tax=Brassica napus TaxID=3708 RepID=A0A816KGW5_BRANA|nr:unnamed protein product [Brassica napus]